MLIKSILKDQITIDNTKEAIKFCSKYFPKQGPLEYFIHRNTLQAFEEINFFDALKYSSSLLNVKTHKSLKWYQSEYARGRILKEDLLKVARKNLKKIDDEVLIEMLHWNQDITFSEHGVVKDKLLSEVSNARIESEIPQQFQQITTFWDYVKDESEKDYLKRTIKETKLNFYSSYFDKGLAYWQMEDQNQGLLYCFSDFVRFLPKTKIKKELLKFVNDSKKIDTNIDRIDYILNLFGVPLEHLNLFVFKVLYELKGWSALVFALDENKNFNPTNINVDIEEYTLINLFLEAAAFKYLNDKNLLYEFEYKTKDSCDRYLDIQSYIYDNLNNQLEDKTKLIEYYNDKILEISCIDESLLFKIWHEAYELYFMDKLINSYALSRSRSKDSHSKEKPAMQVVMCIDDREESTRRYFEEYDSSIKTYGYAGHLGLNIQYKSIREAHFRALCPSSVSADYYVWEELKHDNQHGLKTHRLAQLQHSLFHDSKLPLSGLILTFLLGPFTLMLFVFESFMPEKIHNLRKKLKRLMFPRVETRLNFLSDPSRELHGYTIDEVTDIIFNMLKIMGMTHNFAEIVYMCGHGSKSTNNPHGAAYNCGACSGGKGTANARLMATIGNRSDVRKNLVDRGITIPDTTFFVGGYHCTSSDKLLIFEKENFPKDIVSKLEKACKFVEKKDAKERVRKFLDTPLDISPDKAFISTMNRVYDFSQSRPEYGHNTNAICVIGKREYTKDIFLDRRAFLVDYEEEEDNDSSDNLLELLSSLLPVCIGIGFDYYFSYVDRVNFGAGEKQGHNVTALMGVMNGYKSDLRLGLPWQSVEIHEPMRISCIIEASPEKILTLMEKDQGVKNLIINEWLRVICVKPKDDDYEYSIYEDGAFKEIKPIKSTENWEKLKKKSFDAYISQTRDPLDLFIKE